MRLAILLLIVANLALFAYARLDRAAQGEGVRLAMQVEPERIRPMSAQDVAALAPGKAVATATLCAEWGPFADADRARAEADLATLGPGHVSQRALPGEGATYWVNLGAMPTRAAAERRAAELRGQSIVDLAVADYAAGQFTVSLGVFRTEAAATTRAETLAARGVLGTKVELRPQANGASMLVVRDAREATFARLRELQAQYAGTEVRMTPCPAAS
jgi:sporulation related protein